MFTPVDPKANFPELEARVLKFWKQNAIFEKSVEQRPADNVFVFYEGPPTANNRPGIHHVLARVFKDLIPRYKTMRGYRVPRKAGWDTHGLPVELEIEKELGLRSKPEIEEYGIAAFNARCKESVSRYVEEWTRMSERIGFWADLDHPYVTWHNDYIETCWWIFKEFWDHGLVYQDYRVTPHCPRCGTSLSDHEVSLGYEDDTPDPSVFVKFRVPGSDFRAKTGFDAPNGEHISLVAWTTTPWTLPGNVALAVKADADYGVYEHDGEYLVVAVDLAETVLGESVSHAATVTGEQLTGLTYEPLYRPELLGLEARRFGPDGRLSRLAEGESTDGVRRVVATEYVSLDDGTGIVHTATAFGGEDFDAGKQFRLLFVQPVDLRGFMAEGLPGAGKFVKDADREIIADLQARGLLLKHGIIKHTYPFCWRCGTPLLYYAKPSWYIRTTRQKQALLDGNARINWHPEHIKNGRFGNWLENNIDWAVSRERYWGTPLPFWTCEDCGEPSCVGSRAELTERAANRAAAEVLSDLHRPFIDDIVLTCEACGGTMRRVPEVADAWFDSGAMPYAQWHYPFENEDLFLDRFPADFICEAIDQTRGWFYTLHAEAALLKASEAVPDGIAYKNVICLGHILDAQGNKMSKSKGNTVEPWEVLDLLGADATRWYMYTASPAGSSRRFSLGLVEEGLRRFLLTLWNTYSFFVSYANIDDVDPRAVPDGDVPELDRWLVSELTSLVQRVTDALDNYEPTDAARAIDAFVDDLSNWYVRRSRRRFWRGAAESDTDKQSAYHTLWTSLVTVSKLLAPFTPFVADEMYQNLVRGIDSNAPESVHLTEWPSVEASLIDESLNSETQLVKRICSIGRSARAAAQIKVRQPVAEVAVRARTASEWAALERNASLILEELNAKRLRPIDADASVVTYDVRPNLPVLGRKYGAQLAAIRAELSLLSPAAVAERVLNGDAVDVGGVSLGPDEILLQAHDAPGYATASEEGYTVAITTEITPELAAEGTAREVVRRLQEMRREAGFDLSDRIRSWYTATGAIANALREHGDYVKAETLSVELIQGDPPARAHRAEQEIDGESVTFGVQKSDR